MNKFNEKEFLEICRRFDTKPAVEEITIRYERCNFFDKVKYNVETDRRGEVVFCVIRPNGRIIAITCEEYPEGIYRIPTGGIGHNEDIVEAVKRETMEELGLDTEIEAFAGVLKIRFEYEHESEMFYSYLFILREKGGRLLEDASDDEISEVREVDLTELQDIANSLVSIEGRWSDWGRFRYHSTNAILKYLKGKS